jgi:GntR family transcriptional regulator
LYYQLQEILKEQIESGRWRPGDALPTEMQLTRQFGVSRVCVRQALRILEDDREIVRIQGRGTFVAARKLAYRPVSLIRLFTDPPVEDVTVRVLDKRVGGVESSVSTALEARAQDVLRVTCLWLIADRPFGIGQSFFPLPWADWLRNSRAGTLPTAGSPIDDLELGDVELSVETTQCGQFEADLLGIPGRSTFLLTLALQHGSISEQARPLEFTRLGYRGDAIQLKLRPGRPPASNIVAGLPGVSVS